LNVVHYQHVIITTTTILPSLLLLLLLPPQSFHAPSPAIAAAGVLGDRQRRTRPAGRGLRGRGNHQYDVL
jgi:hypothetical protein